MVLANHFLKQLNKLLPVENQRIFQGEMIVIFNKDEVHSAIFFLKHSMLTQLNCLTAISCVDYPHLENRFEVSYDLLSIVYNQRLRVKTFVNEVTPLVSVISIFKAANWWEREIWDLFGVFFTQHPDLRRILTDYGFQGHPLRKDFPLSGYVEVSYDEKLKRVVSQPLELTQESRNFDLKSSWSTTSSVQRIDN